METLETWKFGKMKTHEKQTENQKHMKIDWNHEHWKTRNMETWTHEKLKE